MTTETIKQAVFKAILRADGQFVAGIAAIPGEDRARFFICQPGEGGESFIGRVSGWVKQQGAQGVEMAPPDVIEEGMEIGELLMRMRLALGAPKGDDASEFDIPGAKVTWSEDARGKSS